MKLRLSTAQALAFWMVPLAVTGPVFAVLPREWQVGQYTQFYITETQGTRLTKATLWRVVESVNTDGVVVVQIIMPDHQPKAAPPSLSRSDLKGSRVSIPRDQLPSFLPDIPGVQGRRIAEGTDAITVSNKQYNCRTDTHDYDATVDGQAVKLQVRRWLSDAAPLGELVRTEETFTLPQQRRRVTVLASSGTTRIPSDREKLLAAAEAMVRGSPHQSDKLVMSLFAKQHINAAIALDDWSNISAMFGSLNDNVGWVHLRGELVAKVLTKNDAAAARSIILAKPADEQNVDILLVNGYLAGDDVPGAIKHIEQMKVGPSNLNENALTYNRRNCRNAVVYYLAKKERLPELKAFVATLPPDSEFLQKLMRLAANRGDMDAAVQAASLAAESIESLKSKSSVSYGLALGELARAMSESGLNCEQTYYAFKNEIKNFSTDDTKSFATTIARAMAICGEEQAAVEIIQRAHPDDLWNLNSIADALIDAGQIERAEKFMTDGPRGYYPSSTTFNRIAAHYIDAEQAEAAVPYLETAIEAFEKEQAEIDSHNAEVDATKGKNAFLHRRVRLGISPWRVTAHLYARLGMYEDALALIERIDPKQSDNRRQVARATAYLAVQAGKPEVVRLAIEKVGPDDRGSMALDFASIFAAAGYENEAWALADFIMDANRAPLVIGERILIEQVLRKDLRGGDATLERLTPNLTSKWELTPPGRIAAALHYVRKGDPNTAGTHLSKITWAPIGTGRWMALGSFGASDSLLISNYHLRTSLDSRPDPYDTGDLIVELGREYGKGLATPAQRAQVGTWLENAKDAAVRATLILGIAQTIPEAASASQ